MAISKVFPPTSKWRGFREWRSNGSTYVSQNFQILKYEKVLDDRFYSQSNRNYSYFLPM